MKLSIVIVSWNTAGLLAQCLASIYANPPDDNFEVLVVDNASTDGSVQMVQQQFPQVTLLANTKNVGFAQANNQAIRQCAGRYILLLNPDTEVKPRALEGLVRFMETHSQAGAAGPQLLNPDGTLQPSCHPVPTLFRELWRLFYLDMLWPFSSYRMAAWDMNTPREVDVVQGAALILRQKALDQIGLLDETYFIYSEEVDLCYRLQKGGWLLYWVPQFEVVHYGGQSTKQVAADMFLRLYQGKLVFIRKHYGQLAARIYKLILLSAASARLLVSPLAWLENSSQRQRHLILAGYYRRLMKALPRF